MFANETEHARQAAALVGSLAAGDAAAAVACFDRTMLETMSADQLGQAWSALLQQVGAFQRTAGARSEKVGDDRVWVVTCRFERASLDVRVVFDPHTAHITGLSFTAATRVADARTGPARDLESLLVNHERLAFDAAPGAEGYRRVCIVGGGAAGCLAALAIQHQLPWVDVTVIESSAIPIIGVGEASVPPLLPFLHRYLGIDVHDFYRAVQPTWKQGIRFEWGDPDGSAFQAPFDWDINDVGIVGSLAATGNVNGATLGAVLMDASRTPVLQGERGKVDSLLPLVPFAYHIDTGRFVKFLHDTAVGRGIHHIDCNIVDVAVNASGEAIDGLIADDGRRFEFDLYVDCSGFRSQLLGKALGTPFQSYQSSLFTDRALAFNTPHNGHIKPYTTATTMDSGWCWTIPMRDDDHCGYVYSSRFCSDDEALAEVRAKYTTIGSARVVQFRSGRYQDMWRGNVVGIGNAYAFVEPLESTGLLMTCTGIGLLVDGLRAGQPNAKLRRLLNDSIAASWDRLRWFLSIHFKFNRRLETPYWREARATTDVSGIQDALDLFQEGAPLSLRPRSIRQKVASITFYEVAGLDCILLGQRVPARMLGVGEDAAAWPARRDAAQRIAAHALPQERALAVVAERPELLDAVLHHERGWYRKIVSRS